MKRDERRFPEIHLIDCLTRKARLLDYVDQIWLLLDYVDQIWLQNLNFFKFWVGLNKPTHAGLTSQGKPC